MDVPDLANPPWCAPEFGGISDKWGDEQDRSDWYESAANYWCSRALADVQVHVVEVFDRQDGIYVFGNEGDAEAFVDAINAGEMAAYLQPQFVINAEMAKRLIEEEKDDG